MGEMEPSIPRKAPRGPRTRPANTTVKSQLRIQNKHSWAEKEKKTTFPFSSRKARKLDCRPWNAGKGELGNQKEAGPPSPDLALGARRSDTPRACPSAGSCSRPGRVVYTEGPERGGLAPLTGPSVYRYPVLRSVQFGALNVLFTRGNENVNKQENVFNLLSHRINAKYTQNGQNED